MSSCEITSVSVNHVSRSEITFVQELDSSLDYFSHSDNKIVLDYNEIISLPFGLES